MSAKNLFKSIALAASIILFSISARGQSQEVPEFTLYKLDSSPFSTANMVKEMPSLFNFFDVTCSHCRVTMQYLSRNYESLKGVSIYLVTLDARTALEKFLAENGSNFIDKPNVTILQDLKYEFVPKFQPRKYPSVFLYDKNNKLKLYQNDERKMNEILFAVRQLN